MSQANTMLAARIVAHGQPLQFVSSIPLPSPGVGQALIKISTSGVCHTDVHVVAGDWDVKSALPLTPGHEGVGVVVAKGDHVNNLELGTRVVIPWLHTSCGACEHCWGGWETVCASQRQTGFVTDGTFAQYCLVDGNFTVKVPEGLADDQAAVISCAGVTVYKGLKVSEVKPGQWVVIVGGSGNLGHVAIQYAKAMGMRVIGLDVGTSKCSFMLELGAEVAVDVKLGHAEVVTAIKKATGGAGAHGALIIAPVAAAIGQAVKYLRPRGVVVVIGLPPGQLTADIFDLVLNAISIKGSIVGTRLDLQEALNLAAEGQVVCRIKKEKFENLNKVLEDLKEGKIKGCVAVDIP